jgi:hypothetical protein
MTHREDNTVRAPPPAVTSSPWRRDIFLLIEPRAITRCNLAHAGIEGTAIGAHYNMATFSPRWTSQG